jgi:hypothetical protein
MIAIDGIVAGTVKVLCRRFRSPLRTRPGVWWAVGYYNLRKRIAMQRPPQLGFSARELHCTSLNIGNLVECTQQLSYITCASATFTQALDRLASRRGEICHSGSASRTVNSTISGKRERAGMAGKRKVN